MESIDWLQTALIYIVCVKKIILRLLCKGRKYFCMGVFYFWISFVLCGSMRLFVSEKL